MKHIITHLSCTALAIGQFTPALAKPTDPSGDRRVSIAYVADIHAQIEPKPELFWADGKEDYVRDAGGLSRIATVFNELRAQRPEEMVFIDGGDTIQGSGPAAWTEGKVVVEPMNAIGLDVAIPGNWSVAYGAAAWKTRSAEFNYKMVAANMADDAGNQLHDPYVIREINGVRMGIIGFTEPAIPTRQPPFMSEGLGFQGAEVLQPLIDELRNEKNADLIVVATHIGLPKAVSLAESLVGVDIMLSSDTHERTYDPIIRGDTWIVEPGAFGSFVGLLDIHVNADNEITDRSWRLIELRPELFPEDPEVKKIVDQALAPHRERMNRVIGHTNVWLARYAVLNTSIDNVITDAIRSKTGADIALSNGFRFAPATAPGAITEADLWTWLPVNLQLKTGQASGAQLLEYWENEFENVFSSDPERLFGGWLPRISGLKVEFNRDAAPGERLRQLIFDGAPIDPDQSFSITAGHRPGAPEHMIHRVPKCEMIRKVEQTTHDAVRTYLNNHSPILNEGAGNVRCLDYSGIIRSQYLESMDVSAAPHLKSTDVLDAH